MRVLIGFATLLGVAIVIGLGMLGIAWIRAAPQPLPAGSEVAVRLADGPYLVSRADFHWVDDTRRTPAHGSYPGAPQRALAVTLWYPENLQGALPLVVYCHGFTSDRFGGRYLAKHLASHGYLVVAADFPSTSMNAPGGPWMNDVVQQPGDVSFLIDRMLNLSDSERPFDGDVDPGRIGVMGLSLGAVTATLVGFHPRWRDPRVAAVVSMAGVGDVFGPDFYRHAVVPFLMIAGTSDDIVDYLTNALPTLERVPTGALVTLWGGTHLGFDDIATSWLRPFRNPDAVGCFLGAGRVRCDTEEPVQRHLRYRAGGSSGRVCLHGPVHTLVRGGDARGATADADEADRPRLLRRAVRHGRRPARRQRDVSVAAHIARADRRQLCRARSMRRRLTATAVSDREVRSAPVPAGRPLGVTLLVWFLVFGMAMSGLSPSRC